MMKKLTMLMLVVFTGLIFYSCDPDAELYKVRVTVEYPDGYDETDLSGFKVSVVNSQSGLKDSALTDAMGLASFDLESGSYTITATLVTADFAFNGILENQSIPGTVEDYTLALNAVALSGGLVFKEIYYTGSRTPEDKIYYADQFHEIYNNSDELIYLDGLCIGVLQPSSSTPSPWVDDEGQLMDKLPVTFMTWMWPGTGTEYPVEPRTSIVLAQDGINHKDDPMGNPNSPVNLGNADWETYFETSGKDTDSPGVPNLMSIYSTTEAMSDWLHSVFGSAVILFRLPSGTDYQSFVADAGNFMTKPGSTSKIEYLMAHKDWIIDAVEIVRVEENKRNKRLPSELDAGMVWCDGTYIKKGVRRKVDKIIDGKVFYKDTNNSSEDFLGNQDPTPGVHPSTVDN